MVDLPIWLAENLHERGLVEVLLPRGYSSKVREAMLAAPTTLKLRDKSPFFYETGLKLSMLCTEEDALMLPNSIKATLAERVALILNKAQHAKDADVSRFLATLTDLEQQLFWLSYNHSKDQRQWHSTMGKLIKAYGGEG